MTVLEKIGIAILAASGKTKESLQTEPAEFSELFLVVDDIGDFALSFETLGQSFILNSKGVFTFNEIGESFALDPAFEAAIIRFLEWRAVTLESFSI